MSTPLWSLLRSGEGEVRAIACLLGARGEIGELNESELPVKLIRDLRKLLILFYVLKLFLPAEDDAAL